MNERRRHPSSPPQSPTRRHVVQALGLAALLPGAMPAIAADRQGNANERSHRAPRIQSFALADVRLLPGAFLAAQERDERYLLQLEPDRMLHNFRANAGLAPKAPVYGGWESQEPWVEIRCHGHTLGHYLSACALMFASTGKPVFKERVDYIVSELRACQDAAKSGLICAFPDGARQLENSVQGREFHGVPWYTMHKIFAGLRDAYWHASSDAALEALRRLAAYTHDLVAPLSGEQMQKMLDREHGGMNEVLADLYAITGEQRYLDLATKFTHLALLAPMVERRDVLDGLHSNTQIPKVIGFQRLYELTGREDYRAAAEFFWRTIIERRRLHLFPGARCAVRQSVHSVDARMARAGSAPDADDAVPERTAHDLHAAARAAEDVRAAHPSARLVCREHDRDQRAPAGASHARPLHRAAARMARRRSHRHEPADATAPRGAAGRAGVRGGDVRADRARRPTRRRRPTPGADIIVNERESGEMLHIPREVPTWKLDRSRLAAQIQADPQRPLAFRASGVRELPNVELIPYYAIAHERYNLYWRLA